MRLVDQSVVVGQDVNYMDVFFTGILNSRGAHIRRVNYSRFVDVFMACGCFLRDEETIKFPGDINCR